ncbi:MAG TPA: metal-sensing transcriptional repressor [Candidatus Caccousia avistercoris]|nr:metal-sensing transcriptional repressor [Candidatus Caccousia avistercoris]
MRADKAKVTRLLKTARGQLDGILKMVEENQYCIDVLNQMLAAEAVLRRAEREVLRAHMEGCVAEAFERADEGEREQKIDEIIKAVEKMEHR